MEFKLNENLPVYETKAENYAHQSANKIHSPEIARKFGFTSGLVPGVAVYAYMTQPIIQALGRDWLEHGFIRAKFLKPIYEEETTRIKCTVSSVDPLEFNIETYNSQGVLCAVGAAGMARPEPAPKIDDYPIHPLPALDDRFSPEAESIPVGTALGSIPLSYDPKDTQAYFFENIRETLPTFSPPENLHHPSFLLHIANMIVYYNIKVGPWIHTSSSVRNFGLPVLDPKVHISGRIKDAYQRRDHEFVTLDLAVFTTESEPMARIEHTAIIRPHGS
ncbi:MAG: hypothetical protein GY866_33800 [Proteobacteria bacterium]|nr:hypothetical protein [Pseudomonadota bacterium]